jgi:hypothetical protein
MGNRPTLERDIIGVIETAPRRLHTARGHGRTNEEFDVTKSTPRTPTLGRLGVVR